MSPTEPPAPEEPNTSIDPYAVLGLSGEASEAEIRSAYKKLALRNHPDKVGASEREAANKKFQDIAFAYAILSDARRRRRYDATGSTAESALDDEDFDWADYFRERYDEITEEKIGELERTYKRSEEERADLLKAYKKYKGRMDAVYEVVLLSNPLEDEDRFQEIIKEAIEAGTVEGYNAFVNESAKSRKRRIDKARREAKEAEEYAEELKQKKDKKGKKRRDAELDVDGSASSDENDEEDEEEDEDIKPKKKSAKANGQSNSKRTKEAAAPGGLGDLAALIQQRQQSRGSNFLDDLEARYAPKNSKGKKKRAPMQEPPEEAFARNGARQSSKKARK